MRPKGGATCIGSTPRKCQVRAFDDGAGSDPIRVILVIELPQQLIGFPFESLD